MTYQISVDQTDIAFPCEAGETVLDAAERAGYSLPYSCRKGICSTCEAELCRGSVTLGGKQNEGPASGVLLCRATPRTDIVIHPKRINRHDPSARKKITAKVYRVSRPADDVYTLLLRFPAGIRARFGAGQYLRVAMPDGDTRNFSMANAPRESDGVQLHIRRIPGGQFSDGVLARLEKGDKLEGEIPFGEFYLRPGSDKPMVCLATGTGFAPIKSIIEDLIARGNTRQVRLYWGGRRQHDLYLSNLAEKWQARISWLQFVPGLSEPQAGWRGAAGPCYARVLRGH